MDNHIVKSTNPISNSKLLMFVSEWKKCEINSINRDVIDKKVTLIFIEESEYNEMPAGGLDLLGNIIIIKKGQKLNRIQEDMYAINPLDINDYYEIFNDLKQKEIMIKNIVYMWNFKEEYNYNDEIENSSIVHVFNIVTGLHKTRTKFLMKLVMLFSNKTGKNIFGKSLGGYSKSLELLYSKMDVCTVEIVNQEKSLSEIIVSEVNTLDTMKNHEISYRNGHRYNNVIKKIDITVQEKVFRMSGVYIVAGGAGGLGVIFARHLAKEYQAKIILLGRRKLNKEIEEVLKELKGYGSQIVYKSCDVTNDAEMKTVIETIKTEVGSINGVIHAAGISSKKIIHKKKLKEFNEILDPKINGVAILDKITKDEELDFFLSFSSISSIIGDFGQCDYAVANRFLDAFTELRNKLVTQGERNGKSISINWPLFESGGMHLKDNGEKLYLQTSGMIYLNEQDGIKAFNKIISSVQSQVVVFSGEENKIEKLLGVNNLIESIAGESGSNMEHIKKLSIEERLEEDISKLVAKILEFGDKKLDIFDNIGEFGFDSITLKEFSDRLSTQYDIEISPTIFFAKSTIRELTEFFLEEFDYEIQEYYEEKIEVKAEVDYSKIDEMQEKSEADNSSIFDIKPFPKRNSKRSNPVTKSSKDIAIIGMSFKLPGANTINELWDNLSEKKDLISEIPLERWDYRKYYSTDVTIDNKTNSKWGGFIKGQDEFDAKFFNISPREAELMDPQQRLYIQAAWSSIEDSGYKISAMSGKKVGVFSGVQFSDYQQLLSASMDKVYAQSSIGNATALLSNRISYLFNFKGPSESIDTACSSSLVALHNAVKSIQNGESEMALAGGVSLMLDPNTYVGAGVMGVFSPEGRCKTFDKSANGYVKGEGLGVLVLKPLEKALLDEDHIYGIIKGSAVNHGGRANSLTAPNSEAQSDLITEALRESEVSVEDISYIEAHGTGTELGDPVEVDGLKQVFKTMKTGEKRIGLGSIKSNIGHLEPASGIAGVIKVLASMKEKKLPGVAHFKTLNPYINIEKTPFYIVEKTIPWKPLGETGTRIAGVSSFGFGGTNAHVIIQEHLSGDNSDMKNSLKENIFVLSAKNKVVLKEYCKLLSDYLTKEISLVNVAYTLQCGREEMSERVAIIANTMEDLKEKLLNVYNNEMSIHNIYRGSTKDRKNNDRQLDKVHEAIEKSNYKRIGDFWTKGESIKWEELWKKSSGRKISLPTYPFNKTHYWIPFKPKKKEKRIVIHALIDFNKSTLQEQIFSKTFYGNEFYIADHGNVLPGVVYLEMARVAGEHSVDNHKVTKIKNVIWSNPIIVDKGEKRIDIGITANGESIDFKVSSSNDGNRVEHAQGKLELEYKDKLSQIEYININEIVKRIEGGRSEADSYYKLLQELGANLGNRFRGIKEFSYNSIEGLSKIGVGDDIANTLEAFSLHPTLLDGGLQSSVAFAYKTGLIENNVLYVPFVLGEVEILNYDEKPYYAYVRSTGNQGLKFNIDFLGKDGQVLIKMNELTIRPMHFDENMTGNNNEAEVETLYFRRNWTKSINQLDDKSFEISNETLLVFNAGKAEKTTVEKFCDDNKIYINKGDKFIKHSDHSYSIDPCCLSDYDSVIEDLSVNRDTSYSVLYFLGGSNGRDEKSLIKEEIYPVFYLSKWLILQKNRAKIKLYCIYKSNGSTVVAYDALEGFYKSIALENKRLKIKLIELKGSNDIERIIGFERQENNDIKIRYKNDIRYIQELEEAVIDRVDTNRIKNKGVYIITGGMGGLGYCIAEHIGINYNAKIVLCGRRKTCDSDKLEYLDDLGIDVIYVSADIGHKKDTENLIDETKKKFGVINGIIHCAGITNDALLSKKDIKQMDLIFAAKIFGTINLYKAVESEDLDVFINFSSSTSIIGNIGQSDYGYANSFIDNFVNNMQGNNNRVDKVINWSFWDEGGMKITQEAKEMLYSKFGMYPISTGNGIKAFENIIASEDKQIMVIDGLAEKLKNMFLTNEKKYEMKSSESTNIKTDDKRYYPMFFEELIGVICKILKTERNEIAEEEELSDMGFDSITFTELTNEINSQFKLEITPTVFFDNSTLALVVETIYFENKEKIDDFYKMETKEEKSVVINRRASEPIIKKQFYGMKQQLEIKNINKENESVAIIGMSGVMPGGSNLDEFWDNIASGKSMITTIPEDRWDWKRFYGDPLIDQEKTDIKFGGFVGEIDKFDSLFFNISPIEAEKMDPQERIMLKTVWHTIEDSGYRPADIKGTRTSVFVGVSNQDYQELLLKDNIPTSMTRTMISNRISYFFDWSGPSEPIDTACSSSLVAVHRAVNSILYDDCKLAIAGGINLIASPNLYIAGSSLGMLSKDGKCKTFDKDANGYVRGEGAGAVLLKPLSQAIIDKDNIYGVIKGTAVNHGGKSNSITSPNLKAQVDVILRAHDRANIDPSTIGYIETHGTGTSLGDPIEIEGLKKSFSVLYKKWGINESKPKCILGSVKTNIGHLEPASGMASLFKVLLAIKNKKIPANINFKEINPYIKLEGTGLRIAKKITNWEAPKSSSMEIIPRRAGISSFGVGGSNAHVLIEEYHNHSKKIKNYKKEGNVIVISAKSKFSLKENCKRLEHFISSEIIKDSHIDDGKDVISKMEKDISLLFHNAMKMDSSEILLEDIFDDYGVDIVKIIEFIDSIRMKYEVDITEEMYNVRSLKEICSFIWEQQADKISQYYCEKRNVDYQLDGSDNLSLTQIAYSFQLTRESMNERVAFVVDDMKDLLLKLNKFIEETVSSHGIYTGNVSNKKSAINELLNNVSGEEFINDLLLSRETTRLAQLWIEGLAIDWSKLYTQAIHPIVLPNYAFDEQRYWLPKARDKNYRLAVHNQEKNKIEKSDIDEKKIIIEDEDELLELLENIQKGVITVKTLDRMIEEILI